MSVSSITKWVRLGDYIEICDERNTEKLYSVQDVRGVSIEKVLILTKANMSGVSLRPYKIVNQKDFVYVTVTSRNGEKISLAMNNLRKTCIVSSSYIVFRSKDCEKLLPEYLYILLSRSEFDRYSRFNSWGSARETFSWDEMCRVEIPLPTIEVQKEIVATYNGLKTLAEENEALIKPLKDACEAFIIDCKKEYNSVLLGDYIEESKDKNINNIYGVTDVRGVTCNSSFDQTKANTTGLKFSNYKIVDKNTFAYNPSRINIGSIALNKERVVIVSPMYIVFYLTKDSIIPEFLNLWFKRLEFQRSTLFYAIGSVRDTFSFKEMCRVEIPLPPIEVQQSIVNLYNCIEEAKNIATNAREQLKKLCPALIQYAINE